MKRKIFAKRKTFVKILLSQRSLLKSAFYHSARWRMARLAAYLLRHTTVQLYSSRASVGNSRILVLNANKAGVLEDVEICFTKAGVYELIGWNSAALDRIAAAILAPSLTHNRYLTTDTAVEASKISYRRFLRQVWKHYTARLPVDVVMSANFGFFVQREFATVLEEVGTPFIVLQKENFNAITPRRADFWRRVYKDGRGKFTGRKILVHNDIERDLQISSGIADPDKIIVTGMPRLDRIHQWRRHHAGQELIRSRPRVLFFGFGRKDKIPSVLGEKKAALNSMLAGPAAREEIDGEWSKLSWERLCAGTCEAISRFARSRPDVEIIVKTKTISAQMDDAIDFLRAGSALPENLRVVTGGDPFELLIESSVVVGFNTTGLIEAVAAGKPVIVPNFAEALDPLMQDIIIDLGESVDYARCPDELVELIAARIDCGGKVPLELPLAQLQMLRRLSGNADGSASHRVREAVYQEIAIR